MAAKINKNKDNKEILLFLTQHNQTFKEASKQAYKPHTKPKILVEEKEDRNSKENFQRTISVHLYVAFWNSVSSAAPVSLLEHKYTDAWTRTRHRSKQVNDTID